MSSYKKRHKKATDLHKNALFRASLEKRGGKKISKKRIKPPRKGEKDAYNKIT